MTFEKRLLDLYAKIPHTMCSASCPGNCCRDIIQFTPTEEKRMGGYSHNGTCCHLVDGKCTVYENRPFVCRLLGASDALRCEKCTAVQYLTEEETARLVKEYAQIMKDEQAYAKENRKDNT